MRDLTDRRVRPGLARTAQQRLAIDGQHNRATRWLVVRGLLLVKELAQQVFELVDIDGVAEHAAPGTLVRHGRAIETEERGKVTRA